MANDLTGLNSLRQALTPYEDVKFELNLNRHPKAHKNKSIIYAQNMKLSKDGAVLENEENVVKNDIIDSVLYDYYSNMYNTNYKIIHIIPCNTELVLFVKGENRNVFEIWRYSENKLINNIQIALFYNKDIPYNGGEFSSTFTYTSNDSLIIAFCEYNSSGKGVMNPMMTINLGTFTNGNYNSSTATHLQYVWQSSNGEFDDRNLEPYKLPICPEVNLPQINNINYIKGKSYIGTYYIYIRYKINSYDYTQWFNIGYPVIIEDKQEFVIHKKVSKNDIDKSDNNNESLAGASETSKIIELKTYINNDFDLINKCINLNINHTSILYDYCQIGFICIAKTYTKYYITSDIKLTNTINISTDIENLKEELFNTNIYENYYNVRNIINKNNKLYISNYETTTSENINVNNVKLSLINEDPIVDVYEKTDEIIINDIVFPLDILLYEYSQTKIPLGRTNGDGWKTINIKYINLAYYLKHVGLENQITSKRIKVIGEKDDTSANTSFIIEDINKCNIYVQEVTIPEAATTYDQDITYKLIGIKDIDLNDNKNYYDSLPVTNYYINYYGKGSQYHNFEKFENYKLCFIDDKGNELNSVLFSNYYSVLENTINVYPENYKASNIYRYNNLDNLTNSNLLSSLCQGEVYDFYIHFIDKYGYVTDGYKLKNTNRTLLVGENLTEPKHFIKPAFFINSDNELRAIKANAKCIIKQNNEDVINIDEYWGGFENNDDGSITIQENVTSDDGSRVDVLIGLYGYEEITIINIKKQFEGLLDLPNNIKYNITWGDVLDYIPIEALRFKDYINSKNELFFKVPKLASNKGDIPLTLKVEINNINDFGNYVSYFISHKKLENTYIFNGVGNKNQLLNVLLNNTNYKTDNIVKTYQITSDDWDPTKNDKCVIQKNMIESNGFTLCSNISNKIAYAGDSQNNRYNRNTTLYLSDVTSDFKGDVLGGEYPLSYIELMNVDKNKYINSDKKLYRLGNIQYNDTIIQNGLNAIYGKHLVIKYGDDKNGVATITSSNGIGSYGNVYLYEIFGFFDFNNFGLYLSERAKTHDIFNKGKTEEEIEFNKIGTDVFYDVITTLNLFNYKVGNIYDTWINFYNIYNSNSNYLTVFNRTIYRSAVISDEGRTNNWRWFENDAYKNIEENKGNITNLLAIGNYLYVHTEHSLFAFSEDNTLSMNNQNLQVATPDIFDTEYKEVFITKLGYGGLQDKDAWVAGQFGYIWFNSDTKKIFKVYGNSMDIISNDIQEWLENCNIASVRFANDIINNRILINVNIADKNWNVKNFILSYNILSKTFISFHDYHFDKSYNTKNKLYYLDNTINEYDKDKYGHNINNTKSYSVSFIINSYYNTIKYIENIIYKLRKRNIKSSQYMFGLIPSGGDFPVEKGLIPYEGTGIRVFNDIIDTGNIVFNSIDSETNQPKNTVNEFQTPYWNLGNWNFNYLRDINNSLDSRLYGNYFVIHFFFGNVDTLIEFEDFDVQLTKDKEL